MRDLEKKNTLVVTICPLCLCRLGDRSKQLDLGRHQHRGRDADGVSRTEDPTTGGRGIHHCNRCVYHVHWIRGVHCRGEDVFNAVQVSATAAQVADEDGRDEIDPFASS